MGELSHACREGACTARARAKRRIALVAFAVMRVALATMTALDQVDLDDQPLSAALRARGHQAASVGWDDPAIRWETFDTVVLRSTWDYHHRRDEFLAWAEAVAGRTRLFNPPVDLRWNSHKFYLRDLERAGLPVVPTVFLERGATAALAHLMDERDWRAAVIKPAVSADSFATERAERGALAAGERHLAEHLPHRDMLVQEYLPAVEEPGERCLIAIDGELSHAIRKRSKFLGGRHVGPEGVPVAIAEDEAATARAILAHLQSVPLYARVDLLRDPAGVPRLMELELVEPSLYFDAAADSADRFVAALERRMGV